MSSSIPNRAQPGVHQPHIVIPYSYADHAFAARLTAELRRDHFTSLIDDIDMSAGAFLTNRIAQAIRPVDCIIPAISGSSFSCGWVQHELKAIMARSFQGRHVRIVPARVDNCALPEFLAGLSCADFHRNGWDAAYGDLIVAIQQHAGLMAARPTQATFRLPTPPRLT